jgi:hypothetical protein
MTAEEDEEEERRFDKACQVVGKFMWGFATLERDITEMFVKLYDIEKTSGMFTLILMGSIDLRKKLDLISLGLKHQEEQAIKDNKAKDQTKKREIWKEIYKRVHELHNIRNIIAHSPFDPAEFSREDDGVDFDYISPTGDSQVPNSIWYLDMRITYSKFDEYDALVNALCQALQTLHDSIEPISDITRELGADIAEIIAASENVIPFPTRLDRNDKE